jgi:DNA-binding MurR/RpiR family transcriptional regulator
MENTVHQDRIREIYVHLSPGYRRIADFLLNRYQEAAFMTAAQVGRATSVDTTLVVRFAQRLGYPGFPELIDDLQADVKRDLRTVYETAPDDNTPSGVLRRVLIRDRNNLEYILLHTDGATFQKIINLLDSAQRVFVTADLGTMALVELFATRLLVLGTTAYVVSSELSGPAAMTLSTKPGDVFLGVGTTPLALGVAAILKMMRRAGVPTIGVVDSPTNPVAGAAEYILVAPMRSVGILPSWTAPAALLHALGEGLALRRVESVTDWVKTSAQRMQEYIEELDKNIEPMTESMERWVSANQES